MEKNTQDSLNSMYADIKVLEERVKQLETDLERFKSMTNNGGCSALKRLHIQVDICAKTAEAAKAMAVKALIAIPSLAGALWLLIKYIIN